MNRISGGAGGGIPFPFGAKFLHFHAVLTQNRFTHPILKLRTHLENHG